MFVCFSISANPSISPVSPLLLYPVNRTFSITCSLLCETSIDLANLIWLVDGQELTEDRHPFRLETISFNEQRLTIFLNKKHRHFTSANYTCRYDGKESSILVRRRTSKYSINLSYDRLISKNTDPFVECSKICVIPFILEEELHRLPRQEGSSSAHLLQTVFGRGRALYPCSYDYVLILLFFSLLKSSIRAMYI